LSALACLLAAALLTTFFFSGSGSATFAIVFFYIYFFGTGLTSLLPALPFPFPYFASTTSVSL